MSVGRLIAPGLAALALAACGESQPSGRKAEEAAATNATADDVGTAREVRGVADSTATGATRPGSAATTTTPPNDLGGGTAGPGPFAPGGPPPTLPEETPPPGEVANRPQS
jgi:hypothetical protein